MRKVIPTKDPEGKVNGWLMELQKDGDKTTAYITAVIPGGFKGYHLHRIRVANYVCLRGEVDIVTFHWNNGWEEKRTTLRFGQELTIPVNVPTGLFNLGDEDAWIANFPSPPYDPLVQEQVEYTLHDLRNNVVK